MDALCMGIMSTFWGIGFELCWMIFMFIRNTYAKVELTRLAYLFQSIGK